MTNPNVLQWFKRRRGGDSLAPIATSVPAVLWCEADLLTAEGGFVTSWTDQSGYGNHLGTPVGGAPSRPAYEATGWAGAAPSVLFDGIGQFMEANLSGPAGPAGLSFVLAVESVSIVSGDRIVYWVCSASAHQITQRPTVMRFSSQGGGARDADSNTRAVWAACSDGTGTDLQWYKNGVANNSVLTGPYGLDPSVGGRFLIAATDSPSAYANIRVGAVMVFRGKLSAADVTAIQTRLAAKGWAA